MSIMQVQALRPEAILKKLTGNTATDIVDATNNVKWVPWFEVNENSGAGTHTVTVAITDGTTTWYPGTDAGSVYVAKAFTAGQSLKFTQGYVLPKGSKLRVTSGSASGLIDVIGAVVDFQ